MTSPDGPYSDRQGDDGLVRYKIRTGEWATGDNRKLHEAFERGLPLIWLRKWRDRVFIPLAPVFLVGAEPAARQYALAIGEDLRLVSQAPLSAIERRYVEVLTKRRLHQPVFRATVIHAYERRCAICSLRHVELLDAAHIIPDAETGGDAVVTNGLALCKIHHAAYDNNVVGIDEHRIVHVAATVLAESDGPMLRFGLQGFHGQALRELPRSVREQPDPDRLQVRFRQFLDRAS